LKNKVLELAVEHWNKNFGGTSALTLQSKLALSNEEIMRLMEQLCDQGKGTINANVELFSIKIDPENPKCEIPKAPTITHIFFPSKEILNEHYYTSKLVRDALPEYQIKLHQGANQIELMYFSDEVLAKYFSHPEFYEINDSLAGGDVTAKNEAPENRYLYVRYGKRKNSDGKATVTAIVKDLANMSPEEQRHWHSYEVKEIEYQQDDINFQRFLARTYDGAWVDFPAPLKNLSQALIDANNLFVTGILFKRTDNDHLRLPVENTKKSFYDSCSELYKLIGPDSLDQKVVKKYLIDVLGVDPSELIHKESGRPLSTLQLIDLIEMKLGLDNAFSKAIRAIGEYRIEADHKLTKGEISTENVVDSFVELVVSFTKKLESFSLSISTNTNTNT
jgi:hypothetical protein